MYTYTIVVYMMPKSNDSLERGYSRCFKKKKFVQMPKEKYIDYVKEAYSDSLPQSKMLKHPKNGQL